MIFMVLLQMWKRQKELLTEAGYADGFDLAIAGPSVY